MGEAQQKQIPPQVMVQTRGKQTNVKLLGAGTLTLVRAETLCDELTSNGAVAEDVRKAAQAVADAIKSLRAKLAPAGKPGDLPGQKTLLDADGGQPPQTAAPASQAAGAAQQSPPAASATAGQSGAGKGK